MYFFSNKPRKREIGTRFEKASETDPNKRTLQKKRQLKPDTRPQNIRQKFCWAIIDKIYARSVKIISALYIWLLSSSESIIPSIDFGSFGKRIDNFEKASETDTLVILISERYKKTTTQTHTKTQTIKQQFCWVIIYLLHARSVKIISPLRIWPNLQFLPISKHRFCTYWEHSWQLRKHNQIIPTRKSYRENFFSKTPLKNTW